jgi:hypothetical protein
MSEAATDFEEIEIPIKVGKKTYFIGCDQYNYILGTKRPSSKKLKSGKDAPDIWNSNTTTYHSSLSMCMERLHNLLIKSKKSVTIDELQKNIILSKEQVVGLYETIKAEDLD